MPTPIKKSFVAVATTLFAASALTVTGASPASAAEAATIAYAAGDDAVVYNVVDPDTKHTYSSPDGEPVEEVRISKTGNRVLYTYWSQPAGGGGAEKLVSRTVGGEQRGVLTLKENETFQDYFSNGASDERVLVSAWNEATDTSVWREYSPTTGKVLNEVAQSSSTGYSQYGPDGDEIISAGTEEIAAHDVASGKKRVIKDVPAGQMTNVQRVSDNGTINYFQHSGECGESMVSRTIDVDGSSDSLFRSSKRDSQAVFSHAAQHVLLFQRHAEDLTVGCAGGGPGPEVLVRIVDDYTDPDATARGAFTARSWDVS